MTLAAPPRHRRNLRRVTLVALSAAAASLILAAPASAVTQTFNYTGAGQNFVVPAGVTQVIVDAYGAQGGNGGTGDGGGLGGGATAAITVTPGETLVVNVGGTGGAGGTGPGGGGGFNGGGSGGNAARGGGGGGGASDVRGGGSALSHRVIVGGGGGGGGVSCAGGSGGGSIGGDGSSCDVGGDLEEGRGGTQSAGGATGTGYNNGATAGTSGSGGAGSNFLVSGVAGGGGGGGLFGGGGGTVDISSVAGGGGGGSGFTADGTGMTNGVRAGNGLVTISYVLAPTLSTNASSNVTLGGNVSDTATLAGGSSPGGDITFRLYGPGDASCSNTPVFTDTKPVNAGNGNYTSAAFTPTAIGTYRWIASYSGDSNNDPVSGACNDANESVTVAAAPTPEPTPEPSPEPAPEPTPPTPDPTLEFTQLDSDRVNGTALLTVAANLPGELRVVKTNKVSAAGPATLNEAGSVKLEIRARGKGLKELLRKGKVKVNPKIAFAPTSGGEPTIRHKVKLKLTLAD